MRYLENYKDSVIVGVKAIFFYEGIGGPLRNLVKSFGDKHQVPVFKHKALREPNKLLKELGETPLQSVVDVQQDGRKGMLLNGYSMKSSE